MKPSVRRRIRRLQNRIKRSEARLRACVDVDQNDARRGALFVIVAACAEDEDEFEALVDDVVDRLDAMIEPSNPIAEWLTDVGIDIAAFAAVVVWKGTRARLEKRLARDRETLKRLENRA